jgi:folate-dependent phosphoribosylglycinamide formyltransferase PurN
MSTSQAVITVLVAVLGGSLASLITAYATRPKTKAEAQNLNAAAGVSISADIREWSQMFVSRTEAAERRADQAEHRANEAESKVDDIEARLILVYGYVRSLREEMKRHALTPPPPPPELEHYWNGSQS